MSCRSHCGHFTACVDVGIVSCCYVGRDKTLMMRHGATRTSSTTRRKSVSKHLVNLGIRSNSETNRIFVRKSINVSSDEEGAQYPNDVKVDSVHDGQLPKNEIGNHCRRYKIELNGKQQQLCF